MLVALLKLSWIISEFLTWRPAQQLIGKCETWSNWLLFLCSPVALYCLGWECQTLAWHWKPHCLDQGCHVSFIPIPSPSSISPPVILPCRLIFSHIKQFYPSQACYKVSTLYVGYLRAFTELSCQLKFPSLTRPAFPLARELLEEKVLDFFIFASFPHSTVPCTF